MKKTNVIVLLGIAFGMTGCAYKSKPDIVRDNPFYKQELKARPEYREDLTPFAQLRANYFTRYLNEGYLIRKITSAAYNADYTKIAEFSALRQFYSLSGSHVLRRKLEKSYNY
ncbi:hypothetical protein [Vibrio salinus]|uniref:hypothetical protein n=1 Tax=Vibrio salinus TaxID=2899784 RepID=UPI001E4D5A34|nr:hypothetical protein [Vibrio salinus]MCE0495450.1 hypothetical protein [Vibrio salinus]